MYLRWLIMETDRKQRQSRGVTASVYKLSRSHRTTNCFSSSCESLLHFFTGQKRPLCSMSNTCDALPTPLTHQYVRLCHTLFSAALLKLIQDVCMGIRSGVSNQSCVSCEGTGRVRLPLTKPVCFPVSAPTLRWAPC